ASTRFARTTSTRSGCDADAHAPLLRRLEYVGLRPSFRAPDGALPAGRALARPARAGPRPRVGGDRGGAERAHRDARRPDRGGAERAPVPAALPAFPRAARPRRDLPRDERRRGALRAAG